MSSYSLGRHCAVCGAPISDDNPDGIGFECRNLMYKKMTSLAFSLHKDRMSEYWNCGLSMLITQTNKMLKEHTGKKAYRSSFKKSFLSSVCIQMQKKHFLSEKQSNILLKFIDEENIYFSEDYYAFVNSERKQIVDSWIKEIKNSSNYDKLIQDMKNNA